MKHNLFLEKEKQILEFWKANDIFQKTEKGIELKGIAKLKQIVFGRKQFVFFDGPPFVTGLPHYGHILVSVIKDAIPRYKTMNGFKMRRKWGWDCHGLPLEVEIEKQIGVKSKKEIEEYGIGKFNQKAKDAIFTYVNDWKKTFPRIGRFVDMENDYRTIYTCYIESVWNIFSRLKNKGLIDKGFKSLYLCPRCETTLSNHEVSQEYRDLEDIAVYISFELENRDLILIAWTTTVWTLLGNVALAVNAKDEYAIVEVDNKKYVTHVDTVERVFIDKEFSILEKITGKSLLGEKYKPLFNYLDYSGNGKVHKVYDADYVSGESGSGIVHISPSYGEDDMKLAQEIGLPIIHHVSKEGVFVDELQEFAGLRPKIKDNPKDVDEKILEKLNSNDNLFKKEMINHSYPVCWRCDTPLLNYATDSWFVNINKFKDKLISENKKVKWIPSHIRDGRFGKWLKGSPDWAISRSRFWGAPIPVWENSKKDMIFISSITDLYQYLKPRNKYYLLRHGLSKKNTNKVVDTVFPGCELHESGIEDAIKAAKKFKDKPTVIYTSPFERTKHTAKLVSKNWNVKIIEDERLRELDLPELNDLGLKEFRKSFSNLVITNGVRVNLAGGESIINMYERVVSFLQEIDSKHKNEVILIVTHNFIIKLFHYIHSGNYPRHNNFLTELHNIRDNYKCITLGANNKHGISPLNFEYIDLPRNDESEIELHKPYIDKIVLTKNGMEYKHCGEVFDCWFESGCVPYASNHYPFTCTNEFNPETNIMFPADFISEGIDQTRGWFYSLLAIGVGAFGKSPYKTVITSGHIKSKDGQKMSKRLKNYTAPDLLIDKYGADSLRHYLLGSPVVQGKDLEFDDNAVYDIQKKIYTRLHNCFVFFSLYKNLQRKNNSRNVLDIFIISRLEEVREKMQKGFETYKLDEAVAPIDNFIDDLSTWYLRRSRNRLREDTIDGAYARGTFYFVLENVSKLMAPVAPFYSDWLYRSLSERGNTSVHLQEWPKKFNINNSVLKNMKLVRKYVSEGHEIRKNNELKVRQPLSYITIETKLKQEYCNLIKDELNVKSVKFGNKIALDLHLTTELKNEWIVNEIVRNIQILRKENKYKADTFINTLVLGCSEQLKLILKENIKTIKSITRVKAIDFVNIDLDNKISIDEYEFSIKFK